ncbi:MAG: hypothetical protein ABSB49_20035 [Polyangia bacterium]|jgi:hypothetical protein
MRLQIVMPDQSSGASAAPITLEPERTLRPLAQVRRIGLVERRVTEGLSQAALDALFAHAEIISEGESSQEGGRATFLGSTMLTFDLQATAEVLSEHPDDATARRLGELLSAEKTLAARIEAVLRQQVERISGRAPVKVHGETRIRMRGARVFLDVDVEALL